MRKITKEQYLEIIYLLQEQHGFAHTGDIADLLNIKAPSVSEMLAKLEKNGLIEYEPYKGARLSEKGMELAKQLIKKHETIADFLKMIGVDKNTAELDACKIEHHISDTSMDKLVKFLEFIKSAPYKPIWLENFLEFLKTGTRPNCQTCPVKKNDKNE
ncbi:MAG: metal-dependent transcriptional regulator [Candidatus Helarchaeota archaeon]